MRNILVAHVGQTPGGVECAETSTGVFSGVFDVVARCGGHTEKAAQKRSHGDGLMAFAAPDDAALKAELDVLGGFEADLFHMEPGIAR